MKNLKLITCGVAVFALGVVAQPQLKEILKIGGVVLIVKQFGKDINKQLNKINLVDTSKGITTKVVPIISGGINSRTSVGIAQVMGPRAQVAKVRAVAQIDQDIFGREVKIRAMIPIDKDTITTNIRRVSQVGVSGTVDLKL